MRAFIALNWARHGFRYLIHHSIGSGSSSLSFRRARYPEINMMPKDIKATNIPAPLFLFTASPKAG